MANGSGSHGQRVGYIRVSTVEQNNQRQKELLANSGRIGRFFEDKILMQESNSHTFAGEVINNAAQIC